MGDSMPSGLVEPVQSYAEQVSTRSMSFMSKSKTIL